MNIKNYQKQNKEKEIRSAKNAFVHLLFTLRIVRPAVYLSPISAEHKGIHFFFTFTSTSPHTHEHKHGFLYFYKSTLFKNHLHDILGQTIVFKNQENYAHPSDMTLCVLYFSP